MFNAYVNGSLPAQCRCVLNVSYSAVVDFILLSNAKLIKAKYNDPQVSKQPSSIPSRKAQLGRVEKYL